MKDLLKKEILDQALCIGDELIENCLYDKDSIYWKNVHMNLQKEIFWISTGSIYSGVAGIILYFAELYKISKLDKYLDIIKRATTWLINYNEKDNSNDYSFLFGKMGAAFTLLKVFEICPENRYLLIALNIAKKSIDHLKNSNITSEFSMGISGILLILMHIHSVTKEKFLLNLINQFILVIIRDSNFAKRGFYWDRSNLNIKGLCGFAHGAAGIGFVMLEVGKYFLNDSCIYLAEKAFEYERNNFDKNNNNWLDFRGPIYNSKSYDDAKIALRNSNLTFFKPNSDITAWCHGAIGIGLSRTRAFELIPRDIYRNDIDISLNKAVETLSRSKSRAKRYVICHGYGGHVDFFLEYQRIIENNQITKLIESVVVKILNVRKHNKQFISGFYDRRLKQTHNLNDRSLFMGITGIGYILLRVLFPQKVDSILLPYIKHESSNGQAQVKCIPRLEISLSKIQKTIVTKYFKNTVTKLSKIDSNMFKRYLSKGEVSLTFSIPKQFYSFIIDLKNKISIEQYHMVLDIFRLEWKKLRLSIITENNVLSQIKEIMLHEDFHKDYLTNLDKTMSSKYAINSDLSIMRTHFNVKMRKGKLIYGNYTSINHNSIVLIPTALGVNEYSIHSLSKQIIKSLLNPNSLNEIINMIILQNKILNLQAKTRTSNIIFQQFLELVKMNVIIKVNSN